MSGTTTPDGIHGVYPDIEIGDRVTRLHDGALGTVTALHPGKYIGSVDVAWDPDETEDDR